MTEKVTDIREAKKKKAPDGEYCYECGECSCGMFWLIDTGAVICANCGTEIGNLTTKETPNGQA